MENINNELQINAIGHPKLSDEYLTDVATYIKKEYRIDITDIKNTEEGYEFKESHGYTAGTLTYDKKLYKWDPLFFNNEIYKLITNKERSEKNKYKRKFTMVRNGVIATGLTAASIAVLINLGVIKLPKNNTQSQIAIETEISDKTNTSNPKEQSNGQNAVKNILNAEDVLLLEWMENTINQIPKDLSEEAVNRLNLMDICTSLYSQALTEYDTYLDNRESLLLSEMVEEPMENAHNNFRNHALNLNEYLKDVDLTIYSYESSPYSSAIITDNMGEKIEKEGTVKGELIDDSGSIVNFYDKENYKIFVRSNEFDKETYDLNNLPDNAIIHNNQVYFESSYLKENKAKTY